MPLPGQCPPDVLLGHYLPVTPQAERTAPHMTFSPSPQKGILLSSSHILIRSLQSINTECENYVISHNVKHQIS